MVQFPAPLRVTVAEEAPPLDTGATDWAPMEQEPVALKFTCKPFGALLDIAVAVTVCGPGRMTELGKGPKTIVWSTVNTAGGEGALERCVGSIATGARVVVIV